MKKILNLILILILSISYTQAHEIECACHKRPPIKKIKEIDKLLDERLSLTQEQKEIIKKNRQDFKKDMNKIINEMEKERNKIRDTYLSGIPELQAKIKTAPSKAHLALLRQQAETLRNEHRKNFEKILTQEQKIEFEKIKAEFAKKEQNKKSI